MLKYIVLLNFGFPEEVNCYFPTVLSNRCRRNEAKTVLKNALSSFVNPSVSAVVLYMNHKGRRIQHESLFSLVVKHIVVKEM